MQPPANTKRYVTWGTGVNLRAQPSVRAQVKARLSGPTAIDVRCQKHAETVEAEGYRNDAWSYLPKYDAWISNIFVDDPAAWLDTVPTCDF